MAENLRSFPIDVSGPSRRTISGSVNYDLCRTSPMSFMYDVLVAAPRLWNDVHKEG